jgi:hypothetical protein
MGKSGTHGHFSGTHGCIVGQVDPGATLVIRSHDGRPFFEAKFRTRVSRSKRRVGPAWLEPDGEGNWKPRRGRITEGYFDERRAHVRAAELVDDFVASSTESARAAREAAARPITFRELAADYTKGLGTDYGASRRPCEITATSWPSRERPIAAAREPPMAGSWPHSGIDRPLVLRPRRSANSCPPSPPAA